MCPGPVDPDNVAEAEVEALYLQDGQELEEVYPVLAEPGPDTLYDDPEPAPEPEPEVLVADPEPEPFPTAPASVLVEATPVSVAVTGHQVTVS